MADDELPTGVVASAARSASTSSPPPTAPVLAIEINPRFQTAMSLVQAQEVAAGLLPMLGVHALASLLPSVPVGRVRTASLALSRLAVPATRSGVLDAIPEPGVLPARCGRVAAAGAHRLVDLPPAAERAA
ncbi:hypothetical protein AB0H12_39230 [Actinosynnema sp. NPDC023794]